MLCVTFFAQTKRVIPLSYVLAHRGVFGRSFFIGASLTIRPTISVKITADSVCFTDQLVRSEWMLATSDLSLTSTLVDLAVQTIGKHLN